MIRRTLTNLARKKNPSFVLHPDADGRTIVADLLDRTLAFLRGCKSLFAGKQPGLFMGSGVTIRGWHKLYYGKGVQIGRNVSINAFGTYGLTLEDYSWIGSHSQIKVSFTWNAPGKYIRIGKHVGIGEFAHLGGAGGLEIGDDCIIGPYFSCHPENHNFSDLRNVIREQGVNQQGIKIGKNCWIGAKVTILDGVTVGDNCVIAAGAVVTKSMPANAVIGGVPAKVIRFREENKLLKVQSVA
jgi:acetyltransferase-like isoleucine patch superfamily enzyme